jgi:DNA-binding XRE family transcriptional regulator
MTIETIRRRGKTYVLVEESEYERLTGEGVPAVPFARASIAKTIIRQREALGWSQAELARRAKLQPATLNRIEKAKVTADEATIARIDRAFKSASKQ